jgi:F-type H+-transporting ATPase subunit b
MKRLSILVALVALALILGLSATDAFAAAEPGDAGAAHVDDKGHSGGGEAKDHLFASDVFSYVWNLLMFLILLGVLWVFVWPKILTGLQAREEKQRSDLVTAENAAKDAQATLAEYKTQLAEARKEAQSIVADARDQAQRAANADKARIEADIQQMKDNATRDIAAAKEEAMSDIYAQVATLSTDIASKILQREIKPDDQRQLIDESIEQVRAKASQN